MWGRQQGGRRGETQAWEGDLGQATADSSCALLSEVFKQHILISVIQEGVFKEISSPSFNGLIFRQGLRVEKG